MYMNITNATAHKLIHDIETNLLYLEYNESDWKIIVYMDMHITAASFTRDNNSYIGLKVLENKKNRIDNYF